MNQSHPSRLLLTSYHCGDLPTVDATSIQQHCARCVPCQTVLHDLSGQQEAFMKAYPFEGIAAVDLQENQPPADTLNSIPQPAQANGTVLPVRAHQTYSLFRDAKRFLAVAASFSIAVVGAILYMQLAAQNTYRIKGSEKITVFVKSNQGIIETRSNHHYYPGEQIQFTYSCTDLNHFMLLSMDTTGVISVYYPESGDLSQPLTRGQSIPLPNSIVLDDYIGPEFYCALFSKDPLNVSSVKEKFLEHYRTNHNLNTLQSISIGPKTNSYPFIIHKEKAPS